MFESRTQLILTPEDFDKKVKDDPVFKDSIAGFSTISLTHILAGHHKSGFSIPRFSMNKFVYMDLCPDVYLRVFKEEPEMCGEENILNLIENNQIYGIDGAMIDFLLKQPRAPRSARSLIFCEVPNYLNHKIQMNPGDFEVFIESNPFITGKATRLIQRMFPDNGQLNQVLLELRRRKGVQVIYGGKEELIAFLEKSNPEPVDDYSVELQKRIPARLVRAIIPLGEYEQHELLKNI